jgi:hypothetical protein
VYVFASTAAVPSPAYSLAMGWFDIRDYGALLSPDDIGPAVQAAGDAAVAYGSGAVFIPPRLDGISRMWGWTTAVVIASNPTQSQSFSIQGVVDQTIIEIAANGPGGGTVLQISDSNAMIEIDGLIFYGEFGGGIINCGCVVHIAQARTGKLTRCQFWGLSCDISQYGVARIIADTTIVDACIFKGCQYAGPAGEGGVLCITGVRDGGRVVGCRWDGADGTFNGVTPYSKSDPATNTHAWVGPQGTAAADPNGFGEVLFGECYFGDTALNSIMCRPVTGYLSKVRVRGCGFNGPSTLNGAPISARKTGQLIVDGCQFGNSAAVYCVAFERGRLFMRNCTTNLDTKTVIFTLFDGIPTQLVELDECEPTFLLDDTSVPGSTPVRGVVKSSGNETVVYPPGNAVAQTLAAGNNNNYTLIGSCDVLRASGGAASVLTGIRAPSALLGRPSEITIINVSATAFDIANLSASSTAANQIRTSTGAAVTLSQNDTATFWYDPVDLIWRQITTVA